MNINELIYIVQKKNDLNRRRRRFYYHMTQKDLSHKAKASYLNGYLKAQKDMKRMTKGMKVARKAIDAKFIWDDSGKIYGVRCGELYIKHTEYKRYTDAHLIETILLRSSK